MANVITLSVNNTTLTLTRDKYEWNYSHVDKWSVSEAGTNLRAVTRLGIPTLNVSYECIDSEVKTLIGFDKAGSLSVKYWDEVAGAEKTWACCMTDFKVSLQMENGTNRFYKVSFKLKDLEN